MKPNKLCACEMTVQDNLFLEAPIFIATEDHDFIIPLSSKVTIFGVTPRTPTDQELHTCPHATFLSAHEWDPHNVRFTQSLRTLEENISRNIGGVMTQGGSTDVTDTDSDNDSVDQIYKISAMTRHMISSVQVATIPSRNLSKIEATVQDVPQKIRSSLKDVIQLCNQKN